MRDGERRTLSVPGYTATVESSTSPGLLVAYVDGMPGAHTQAESSDELRSNLIEMIELVTECDSASAHPAEERTSAREN